MEEKDTSFEEFFGAFEGEGGNQTDTAEETAESETTEEVTEETTDETQGEPEGVETAEEVTEEEAEKDGAEGGDEGDGGNSEQKFTIKVNKVVISTAGNPTSYTYQWYKNGSAVSGATSASYTFTPTAVGTTTLYCKVTNAAGTVTSRTATITATVLYLYNAGDQCTSITGGWIASGKMGGWTNLGSVNFNDNNMELVSNVYGSISVRATNTIDLTNYSALKATFTRTATSSTSDCVRLSALNDLTLGSWNWANTAATGLDKTIAATISVDISSVTGSKYIAIGVGAELSSYTATITKVWLE